MMTIAPSPAPELFRFLARSSSIAGWRSAPPRSVLVYVVLIAACLLSRHGMADSAWPATGSVERTVHWAPSPTQDANGHDLPPAVAYEVWLTVDARPESLAAVVPDSQVTLVLEAGSTHVVRVRARSAAGALSLFSEPSDPFLGAKDVAGVDGPPTPAVFGPAWPNPFNARVTLPYRVPDVLATDAAFGLTIHDLRGNLVATLRLDRLPGTHAVVWSGVDRLGRRLPSGVYVARYRCGSGVSNVRLTLVS
ncbi:MAG: hypothetical protein IPK64_04520 [bacterium]|nr:hypothetical protein [bacterium]